MNEKESDHEGIGSVTNHIITNQNFLKNSINLWEFHSTESYSQKRARQNKLA